VAKLIHSMIRVAEEARSVTFCEQMFGGRATILRA
jgi:hypothetical protein